MSQGISFKQNQKLSCQISSLIK